jgi:hypothetical protein
MGKASRRDRREADRVLREVGVVHLVTADGREIELVGREADELRDFMRGQCPICRAGGSHS